MTAPLPLIWTSWTATDYPNFISFFDQFQQLLNHPWQNSNEREDESCPGLQGVSLLQYLKHDRTSLYKIIVLRSPNVERNTMRTHDITLN